MTADLLAAVTAYLSALDEDRNDAAAVSIAERRCRASANDQSAGEAYVEMCRQKAKTSERLLAAEVVLRDAASKVTHTLEERRVIAFETIAAAAKHRELVAMRSAAINDNEFEPVVSAEIDRVLAVLLPGWK